MLPFLNGQETLKNALRESMRSLEAVGANVLGTVVNNVKGGYYGYGGYAYDRS